MLPADALWGSVRVAPQAREERQPKRSPMDEKQTAHRCPALLIAAPASGQGKTTVTAALARRFRARGLRVRVFKVGPDFIDPMILEAASGVPVEQLDLWMVGEARCRSLLNEAASEADLLLVEGVMGLFDGEPSSADLAARLGLPVLAVIDASHMAQSFAAVALGLATLRDDVTLAGVFANGVAGEGHAALLTARLPATIPFRGWLARDAGSALAHRHLGLVQAAEVADLEVRLDRAAAAMTWDDDLPLAPVAFAPAPQPPLPAVLSGVRIAVARDAAFSFLYQSNLDLLRALGAELRFFSPLSDGSLPEADSLYLPGGYPELHLAALAGNQSLGESIRAHHRARKPILAECGGMLYLAESLTDVEGRRAPMVGLLPAEAAMAPHLTALALQRVPLPEGELRGHTFHHSRLTSRATPITHGRCPNGGATAEAVYRDGRLTASYVHFYFASQAEAAARLFLP